MNSGKASPRGIADEKRGGTGTATTVEVLVVEPGHIDAVLSVALHGPADFDPMRYPGWERPPVEGLSGRDGELSAENATEVGAALLAGCLASVSHRLGAGRPGESGSSSPEAYQFRDLGRVLTIAECCKALACLEVQSGEDPSWPDSPARAFCGALLWRLISALPGYEAAPWEISMEFLLGRVGASAL